MNPIASSGPAVGLCLALAAAAAGAQSLPQDLGEFEYMNSCAVCHGASGDGSGPMLDQLTNRPADLTRLSADNGGVFPVSRVYDTITGADRVGAHGTSEMPAWGQRFGARVAGDREFLGAAQESYVRTRILALIEYLSTLQK